MKEIKMRDMGQSRKETDIVESPEKDGKHYPSLFLNTGQLPELKDKEPGDKIVLHVEAEVKGYSLRSTKDKKAEANYDLDIHKIGVAGSKTRKEDEDDEDLKETVKKRMRAGRNY